MLSIAAPAAAQGESDSTAAANPVIVVTGSFIRGTPEDAALPVDVFSSEDLSQNGVSSPLEFIKELPSVGSVLGDTNQFSTAAQGFQGAGSINLRGLGSERTLVLFNGRRTVVHPGAGFVDTNLLPIFALDRIEILKDGAAATYGSDAIGGVANFVTRTGFDGVELTADYEFINGSDDDYTVSALIGQTFGDANFLIGAGYQHRSQLQAIQRDYTNLPYAVNPVHSALGNPGAYIPTLGGVPVAGPVQDGAAINICGNTGGTPDGLLCRFNFVPFDNLVEEQDRYQVYGQMDVDLTDRLSFHAEALWARTEQLEDRFSPSFPPTQGPRGPGFLGAFSVPRTNPGFEGFIAQSGLTGTTADMLADGALILLFRPIALGGNPATGGLGGQLGTRINDAWRVNGGFDYEISDNFRVASYATYFRSNRTEFLTDILGERLQNALNGFGGANCTGVTPGQNGCLYFNPFANSFPANPTTGQVNPGYIPGNENNVDLINFVFQNNGVIEHEDQFVYDLIFSGETGIDFGGGPVAYAFGAQYRYSNFVSTPINTFSNRNENPCPLIGDFSCLATPGQNIGPFIFLGQSAPVDLTQNVYAAFAEVNIPIGDTLEITGAIRYEDYGGSVGSTVNPKGSIRWEPTDWLVLRGSVGTTFRGPLPGQVAPNSVTSLAGIQAAANNFKSVDIFGNPTDLGPETAFTYNIGAIIDYAGFTFSVDYWSYDFSDRITTTPGQAVASTVISGGPSGNGTNFANCASPLVDLITFGGAGCVQGTTTGLDIARVRTDWVNGPGVQTSGIDFALDFTTDLGPGVFSIGGQASHVLDYDVEDFVFRGTLLQQGYDADGFANFFRDPGTIAKWRANGYVNYNVSGLNLRYTVQFIDGVTDDRCVGLPACRVTSFGPTDFGRFIDSYTQHDIHVSYELPTNFVDATLQFGIENFTNEDPSAAQLELGYNPFIGNPIGRVYRMGVRLGF
ncbi:MAG: TonB-dependent receptor [Sphingomonadaceae bacterium]|nr:TonB-dependent receptor [Sphingomonadaceae bacterium]